MPLIPGILKEHSSIELYPSVNEYVYPATGQTFMT